VKARGTRLRDVRISKLVTLKAMSEAIGVGICDISAIELGRKWAPASFFAKCAAALGVDVNQITNDKGTLITTTMERYETALKDIASKRGYVSNEGVDEMARIAKNALNGQ